MFHYKLHKDLNGICEMLFQMFLALYLLLQSLSGVILKLHSVYEVLT